MADEHVPVDYYVAGSDDETASTRKAVKDGAKKARKEKPDLFTLASEELAALFNTVRAAPEDGAVVFSKAAFDRAPLDKLYTGARAGADKKPLSTLVLCGSALRCIEVMRALQTARPSVRSVKLFAKHMRADEQLAFLKRTDRPAAVGTPGRVLELVRRDASVFANVRMVVVDAARDVKERTVLDIPETSAPLLALLRGPLRAQIEAGALSVVLAR